MLFRYDFGEKLDLTKFTIQAKHYIGQMREIDYHLVLVNYKLTVSISTPDNVTSHFISIKISQIDRDEDGAIKNEKTIYPISDVRFQEFKIIKEIWTSNIAIANCTSNSSSDTVDKIIKLLKIINKINNLRVFI